MGEIENYKERKKMEAIFWHLDYMFGYAIDCMCECQKERLRELKSEVVSQVEDFYLTTVGRDYEAFMDCMTSVGCAYP